MPEKRAIMRIQLDNSAKLELDKMCEIRGMTQVSLISRLVGWFVRQDAGVQMAVLTSLSDDNMSQIAKQLLKRLATERPGSKTPR